MQQVTYPIGTSVTWVFPNISTPSEVYSYAVTETRTEAVNIELKYRRGIESVNVSFITSPSLNGIYLLCNVTEEPLLCGGKVHLTVTGMYVYAKREHKYRCGRHFTYK